MTGETSLEAAIQEGKEELGIDVEIDKLVFVYNCELFGGEVVF